jgi:hypothetical protein
VKDCLVTLDSCKYGLDLPVPMVNSWAKICAEHGISPPPSSAPAPADMSRKRTNKISSLCAQLKVCSQKIDGDLYPSLRISKSNTESYAKRLDDFLWDKAKGDARVYSDVIGECLTTLAQCQAAIKEESEQDVVPWFNFLSHHFPDKGHAIKPALEVSTDPASANIGATKIGSTGADQMDTTSPYVSFTGNGPTDIDHMDISSDDVPSLNTVAPKAQNIFAHGTGVPFMNSLSTASGFTNTPFTAIASTNTPFPSTTSVDTTSVEISSLAAPSNDPVSGTGSSRLIWDLPVNHEPLLSNQAQS